MKEVISGAEMYDLRFYPKSGKPDDWKKYRWDTGSLTYILKTQTEILELITTGEIMSIENRYQNKKGLIVQLTFWPDGKNVTIRIDGDDERYNISKDLAMKLFSLAP